MSVDDDDNDDVSTSTGAPAADAQSAYCRICISDGATARQRRAAI